MAEPQCFVLADIRDCSTVHVGCLQNFQQLGFALLAQFGLELGGVVKVILQGTLAARGNENEFLDARSARLIDSVLDQRTVHQSHNFFGYRFRCRQKACSQSGNRKNGFGNFLSHFSILASNPVILPSPALEQHQLILSRTIEMVRN